MLKSIDHIVILVKDLEQAQADYSALGFVVVPGGEHSDGSTHNALVAFADGTYLELIAFKKPNPNHRWWKYQESGEGLIDFALLPTAIADDIAAANARGLAMQGPFPGGRARPDGQILEWQTGTPPSHDLPFLCGDVTPRSLRVPGAEFWHHPNGIKGIVRLEVLVKNLSESISHYQALLGIEPQAASFNIGLATISLVEPPADHPTMADLLDQRGEGPLRLVFSSDKAQPGAKLDAQLSHTVLPFELE